MGDRSDDGCGFQWGTRWGRYYEEARKVGLSDGEAVDWANAQFKPKPQQPPEPGLFEAIATAEE